MSAVRAEPPALPIGPLALCASLEARGFRVRFADYQAWEGPGLGRPGPFAAWLDDPAPVLGISVFTSSLPLVLVAAPRLKASRPDRWIVLGGAGTTGVERELVERFPTIDCVVHGEGDDTLPEIVQARRAGGPLRAVAGVTCRDRDGVHVTAPRRRIRDLSRLPTPAYHLADLRPYRDPHVEGFTPFGVMLSRGCPFSCTFCAVPGQWQGEVHARDPQLLVDEVRLLRDRYGATAFRILDDTFTADRQRAMAFCERLAAARVDLPWLCLARVDLVDEPLIEALAAAGCRLVFYGLESGSDRVLRHLAKGFTVARALDVVEMSRRHVEVEASFMWGFPFESQEDLYDTLLALLEVRGMGARTKLSWFVPLHATALVREYGSCLSDVMRQAVFPARSHMDPYRYGRDLLSLVRAHRDIFSSFYYLDGPGHREKMGYLKRIAARAAGDGDASALARRPAGRARPVRDPAAPLPAVRRGCSVRHVGGRRFLFDARVVRAFHVSPFGERVFEGCQRRETLAGLVADLSARRGSPPRDVAAAVREVLGLLDAQGFLERSRGPRRHPSEAS